MKTTRLIPLLKNWKVIAVVCTASWQCHVNGSNIFVAGSGSGAVQEFNTATGSSTMFASGLASPTGLAFDAAGNLYVGARNSSTLYRYGPDGVGTIFATAGLNFPMGLVVGGDGNIYAANIGGNNITEYTPNGVETVFADLSQPKCLTFDSTGDLYVSTGDNTIVRYDPQGNSQIFASSDDGLNGPLAMQFDAKGDLFVANYWSSDILERNAAGNWSVFATTPPGYSNPLGLALDPDGSMYVTCAGNFIEKYDRQGHGSRFATTVNGPAMIAVEPVPEPSSAAIFIITAGTIGLRTFKKR